MIPKPLCYAIPDREEVMENKRVLLRKSRMRVFRAPAFGSI